MLNFLQRFLAYRRQSTGTGYMQGPVPLNVVARQLRFGSLAVMCCGCEAMLGKRGERIVPVPEDPTVMFNGRALRISGGEGVAYFEDRAACDRAALLAGWTIQDSEGSNHRCPECQEARMERIEAMPHNRGAILRIDWQARTAVKLNDTPKATIANG